MSGTVHYPERTTDPGKVSVPDYDERDKYGETQSAPETPETLGAHDVADAADSFDPFDAFRARRAEERAEQEPFPEQLGSEPAGPVDPALETYGGGYSSPVPPPYEQYTQVAPPMPFDESALRAPRHRLRSAIAFGGVAALV